MNRQLLGISAWIGAFLLAGAASANGVMIPTDKSLPPLGIVSQRVNVEIRDQAAVTRVEQVFRNSSSQQLEAEYIFPLPVGAGVKDFAMWVDGKRLAPEMVEAGKARQIYEDIVRRMKDPGLLEHIGNDLWRVRVFPVMPNSRQKIELSFSQVVKRDSGVVEYVYPLKTSRTTSRVEEDFTLRAEVHSTPDLKSIYSPSHNVSVSKDGEHRAVVGFEERGIALDRDFRLYWTVSDKDVGLSTITHRENEFDDGYFLLLMSPPTIGVETKRVPRDVVFVIDTSGSMEGEKFQQAKRSLELCLKKLDRADRFGLIAFSTTVEPFSSGLTNVDDGGIERANRWIGNLRAAGGTAIQDALLEAMKMRSDASRNFTVVFMTDGLPTIGETDSNNILRKIEAQNNADTRIFALGIGNDVNTHLLDQLADKTKSLSAYIRPSENVETSVTSFYDKISHPLFANLKLDLRSSNITLKEMYPPKLPDLFKGGQVLVFGRYSGTGSAAFALTGKLGDEQKEFVYEASFPAKKIEGEFLPGLWARRKVGYLLDQIRLSGENRELIDEVVKLSKKFGIATPYTSYLIIPDQMPPIVNRPVPREPRLPPVRPFSQGAAGRNVSDGDVAALSKPSSTGAPSAGEAENATRMMFERGVGGLKADSGAAAVDVAQSLDHFKRSGVAVAEGAKTIGAKTFHNVQGVWIDSQYNNNIQTVKVKYLSNAYFKLLTAAPEAKDVLALGESIAWVAPSGTAIVIDAEGVEELSDNEIRKLFKR